MLELDGPAVTTPALYFEIAENRAQVEANDFPTDRGLRRRSRSAGTSYFGFRGFGQVLRTEMLKLAEDSLWIDVGAGELFAQMDFASGKFSTSHQVRMGAITVASPQTEDFYKNLEYLGRKQDFFYLTGRRIEDIPVEELPKADLVSDLFAAVSFSEHVDQTLQKELEMLKTGGVLVARFQKVFIRDREGKRYSRRKYMSSIKGAELVLCGWNSVAFRRTGGQVEVPELVLTALLSAKSAPNPKGLNPQFVYCERYYVLK